MIENAWFYYFSSLAQTIAACSALLVALAVIRLQNFYNSLNAVERSIAELFFNIDEQDNYRRQTSMHFQNEEWIHYFHNVRELAESNINKFAVTGDYTESKAFLDSLIEQGCKLEVRRHQLHNALVYAFVGTIVFVGTTILIIPIAQWISSFILWLSWAVSGISLVALFTIYLRLVLNIWKPNRTEESR